MFGKFQNLIHKIRRSRNAEELSDVLDIKNKTVTINNAEYFVARAQVTDVPEMLKVEQIVYGDTPWNEAAFSREIKRKSDRLYVVVRKNDVLLAYAGCSFSEKRRDAHLTNIAVMPAYQGRGIGRYLIQYLIHKAYQLDFHQMSLEVRKSNGAARQLYKKIGFIEKGIKKRYYFGDHEDAINMVLTLDYLKK